MIEQYLKILDSFKEALFSQQLRTLRDKILTIVLSDKFNTRIATYFSNSQENGEPFSNFASEPKQIIVLKTLINALYHGELAFKDLETVNFRDWRHCLKDGWTVYTHTSSEAYKACYLLTHLITQLESGLTDHFSDEIHEITTLMSQVLPLIATYVDSASSFKDQFQHYPLSYKIGQVCGITTDQMDKSHGAMDYEFLTRFAATLPAYIHRFSACLQRYSSQFEHYHPELNKQKMNELRSEADSLLNEIENLRSNDFFLPLKAVNYIYIIRHIINLTMSIWEEMGYMNDSAQNAICEKIIALKYNYLIHLISLIDSTEVYTLLKPGVISEKFISSIEGLYSTLIDYAGKFVNFSEKSPSLVMKLQGAQGDPSFIELRTQKIYERIAENTYEETFLAKRIKLSLIHFFNILGKPNYQNLSLNELSLRTRQALRGQYRHLQPYVKKIDINLHNNIVLALGDSNNCIEKRWFKFPFQSDPMKIGTLTFLRAKLETLLTQQVETNKLQILLNKDLLAHVLKANFLHVEQAWAARKEMDLRLAQQHYESTHGARELIIDTNGGAREGLLIKHTRYSRGVIQFRETLFQLLPLLGEPIYTQLKTNLKAGIPFPEIENETGVLEEACQILLFKRLFNTLGHLEKIIIKFEELSPLSTESIYVWHLIQVYNHFFTLRKLINELYADPYLAPLLADLSSKFLAFYQLVKKHSSPYLSQPNEITLPWNDGTVEYGSLWYPLQGFLTLPSHLLALRSKRDLSNLELKRIQKKSKKISIKIERIIKDSSSYFRLLLHSPTMYCLFRELRKSLNEFTAVTHETIISKLRKINTILFTRILTETDRFEDHLGLKPGLLTEVMKALLDEFYHGLIDPLGLKPQVNIALLGSTFSTEKRIDNISQYLTSAEERYRKIFTIYEFANRCEDAFNEIVIGHESSYHTIGNSLLEQTEQLCAQVNTFINSEDLTPLSKTVLNRTVQQLDDCYQNEPRLLTSTFLSSAPAMKSSLRGLLKTQQVTIDIARHKIAFLEAYKENQICEKAHLLDQYTRKSYANLVTHLMQRNLNLHHLKDEYVGKLQNFLLAESNSIIAEATQVSDIAERLEFLALTKITNFDNQNAKNYLQLEDILVLIKQFEMYCINARQAINNNRSFFENENTLSKKTTMIKELKRIALGCESTPASRISQIKNILRGNAFKQIMLDYKNYNSFCFGWLYRKILLLLATLRVYTPQANLLHHQLQQTIAKPSSQKLFIKQYGLFKPRARDYAFPQAEIDNDLFIPPMTQPNLS